MTGTFNNDIENMGMTINTNRMSSALHGSISPDDTTSSNPLMDWAINNPISRHESVLPDGLRDWAIEDASPYEPASFRELQAWATNIPISPDSSTSSNSLTAWASESPISSDTSVASRGLMAWASTSKSRSRSSLSSPADSLRAWASESEIDSTSSLTSTTDNFMAWADESDSISERSLRSLTEYNIPDIPTASPASEFDVEMPDASDLSSPVSSSYANTIMAEADLQRPATPMDWTPLATTANEARNPASFHPIYRHRLHNYAQLCATAKQNLEDASQRLQDAKIRLMLYEDKIDALPDTLSRLLIEVHHERDVSRSIVEALEAFTSTYEAWVSHWKQRMASVRILKPLRVEIP